MLPLRFPNSGIRAKVFMRKIGFKLRVMILNRVESFYAFLLHFCSERSNEGRPPTGRPTIGGRLDARKRLLAEVVVSHGHGQLQGAHKGLSPATSTTANRGDGADCPLAGWLPTGKGSRRLCRGSGDSSGTVNVKEG
ncbi:hypothetical protein BHE74_00016742 [Ensete ventricosum]|nr:hypothetical protein BHE74_00016742 [Ensete ventricosum]RZS02604.1 hypothetical protein BHM03_00032663 [Ensete ventricosum]